MKKLLWLTLPLLLAFAGRPGLYGQTQVSGDVLTNTTWTLANSPYQVIGSVRVTPTAVLTIEAGVVVEFDATMQMDIEGSLQALGTSQDSIIFRAAIQTPDTGFWAGLTVDGSGGFADLQYCRISNASAALELQGSSTVSRIDMENSSVQGCARALKSWTAGSGTVRRCNFFGNYIAVQSSDLVIRRSTFTGNDYGILNSTCNVDSCTFSYSVIAAVANSRGHIAQSLFVSNAIGLQGYTVVALDSITGCQFAENSVALTTSTDLNSFAGNELCSNTVNVEVSSANNLSIGPNCWCTEDSAAIQSTLIDGRNTPGLGVLNFFPLDSSCKAIQQVWPGDTDEDGVASIKDMLHIGVAFGFTGAPRNNPTAGWIGQAGLPWDQNFAGGLNYKHADCNGNGLVELADTLSILQNYGQTHYKTHRVVAQGGIPLYLDVPQLAGPGDTIEINIRLGDALDPAIDVYGLSFELDLDPTVVQTATAESNLDGTWLGDPGQNLIDLDYNNGDFAWAIVRTDHQDTIGNGRIGGVSIVMIDDLTRMIPFDSLFSVSEAVLINKDGQNIDVSPAIVPISSMGPGFRVGPNPAENMFRIALDTLVAEEVAIFAPNGQMHYRQSGQISGQVTIDASQYQPGLYFVRVRLRNGLLTRKIYILR